jgi:isoleucyl-tRNA synthetase
MNDDELKPITLVSLSTMAREWGISRQRAWKLSQKSDFPEPTFSAKSATGKVVHRIWTWKSVNDWHEEFLRTK